MFEMLLSFSGNRGTEYDWSGPGSKYLVAGDEQLGYFGPLQSSELFTVSQLNAVAPSPGATLLEDSGWLKFFYKGKVIFIAMKHHRSTVSWDMLYQSGLVYGVNGNGNFPYNNPLTNQLVVVSKKNLVGEWAFKVRCIGAANRESPLQTNEIQTSEFTQLLGPVRRVPGTSTPGIWGNYTDPELGLTVVSHGWETLGGSNSSCGRLRPNDVIQTQVKDTTERAQFRPVLEIVPPDEIPLYGAARISGTPDLNGAFSPYVTGIIQNVGITKYRRPWSEVVLPQEAVVLNVGPGDVLLPVLRSSVEIKTTNLQELTISDITYT